MIEKVIERLRPGNYIIKNEIEKDPTVAEFLRKPVSELNYRYSNLFGREIEVNGTKIPVNLSNTTLASIINNRIDFGDFSDFDDNSFSSYFVQLDDSDTYVGFLSFKKDDTGDKIIDEVVLFSFDAENHRYNSQIYKDFEKELQRLISRGFLISWCCLKQNHANINYTNPVNKYSGKIIDEGDRYRYIVGEN